MTRGVPSHETREGWWYHASQEEKLAQIDSGIKLGLTAYQVGKNCGTDDGTVFSFARWHGRSFGDAAAVRADANIKPRLRRLTAREQRAALRKAYFSGEPVDFSGWADA